MQRPLVSVVVPAFNAERTLEETVRSALASTFDDIELIIVDDGSTDGTARIAEQFVDADRRVQLVRRANGGLSAALNSGFGRSLGKYVARLDADDLWHPEKLARQLELARERPEVAFIYTGFRFIDLQGRVLGDAPLQNFPAHALCRGVYETLIGTGSSVLIRRSALEEAGGCEESLPTWEDLLLQLKISAKHSVALIPEYLVGYRVTPGSITHDPQGMLSVWLKLRERIKQLFPQVPKYVQDWGHGTRCLEFAESFAWRGEYRKSAALLLAALRHDPEWTLRLLAYRVGRFARKRFSRSAPIATGTPFLECDPTAPTGLSRHVLPPIGGSLLGLHERRVQHLAELDLHVSARQHNPQIGRAASPLPRAGTGGETSRPARDHF